MSVTTLDPNTALVVIDLQKGIVGLSVEPSAANVIENTVQLLTAFRERGLPVVLVNVDGGAPGRTEQSHGVAGAARPAGWDELVPELGAQSGDYLVTKRSWGAFTNTGLDAYLRGQGVTQVVVVGIATSIGVESTARQAYEHGYNVTLATDAMADRNAATHRNSIELIFPRLGETGTTAEVLELLGSRDAGVA